MLLKSAQSGFRRGDWRAAEAAWHRSPVFRRERLYWDRHLGGLWRLDDLFVGLALFNLCLLPAALLIYPPLLLVYGLLDETLALLSAFPAALGVSRERRGRTWALLRVTPLSGRQIILAKLAGLASLAGEGTALLSRARWLGTAAAVPLFGLMLTVAPPFPFRSWAGLAAGAAAYLAFIYRPQLNVLSGAALGLACSTLDRGVSASLTYVALAGLALLAAGAALVLAFHGAPLMAGLFTTGVLAGRLALLAVWLLPLALLTGLRLGLSVAGLAWAAWRLPQLEE